MKRYISKSLKLISLLFIGFPITFLTLSALLFDVPFGSLIRMMISPMFIGITIISIYSGYGLWEMKRWAWYVFLVANIGIGYFAAVTAADFGESHYKGIAFILFVLGQVALIFRVAREVKVPYFLPRIRWWENDPRYRLTVPVQIRRNDGSESTGDILDLSLGGCFIKIRTDLLEDETIQVSFKIFGVTMACVGSVVWRTHGAVTHPKGVGLKFAPMTKPETKRIKAINNRLKEMATLYRTSRYLMSQEDFIKRMEELQSQEITE